MTRDEKITRLAALATARAPDYPLIAPFSFEHDARPNGYPRLRASNGVWHTWQVADLPDSTVLVDGRGQLAPEGTKAGDILHLSPPSQYMPNGYRARRFPCFRQDIDEQLDVLIKHEEALARDARDR